MGCVYKITNKINGKSYIGYTTRTVEARWKQHIVCAKKHQKDGSYNDAFKRAIRKYGEDNFSVEIIEESNDKHYLQEREKYWIDYYNTLTINKNSWGYNETVGGQGGNGQYKPVYKIDIMTGNIEEEYFSGQEAVSKNNSTLTRVLISPDKPYTCQGKSFMYKSEVDKMSKEKLIDILYSRYNIVCQFSLDGKLLRYFRDIQDASDKTGISYATIANAVCGVRKRGDNYQWCYYRDKDSKANKKIINLNGCKTVAKLDNKGNVLETYPSAKEAGLINQCDASAIGKVCKGFRKTCGGYKWRYVEE